MASARLGAGTQTVIIFRSKNISFHELVGPSEKRSSLSSGQVFINKEILSFDKLLSDIVNFVSTHHVSILPACNLAASGGNKSRVRNLLRSAITRLPVKFDCDRKSTKITYMEKGKPDQNLCLRKNFGFNSDIIFYP